MPKIPVHIITGFLGSGKTTFLNHFIRERLPERTFVIENECGATNVDGGLIMEGVEEVVELSAGCLCCSLADGLLDILVEVGKRTGEYDRLVIETTGIADPGSIVQVFLTNPRVEEVFELEQVICLVDAGLVEEWLEEAEEALRQVALADVLLVNKIDTVPGADSIRVGELLKGINPNAKVLTGVQGVFPITEILKTGTTRPEQVEAISDHGHHHHEHHHHHDEGTGNSHKITTFTLTFPYPVDLNRFHQDLNRLVMAHRNQVYRVKGFIAIPNVPIRVILQSARSLFITTEGTPWEDAESREGKLVFIGRGLKKEVFEQMLSSYLVEPPANPARVAYS